ncbi:MAG: Pyruvate-ferrodoxin oxidoreductase [Streblomastix strix]|uniref:Pyruvate-ferrodoxin oxidoreductase n=1 Tax=Streblomastix strix TaxID=222440 RepID=A0A5J4WYB2_9EUKA|nr:MAG: Pyruvate-ferrodoxin oxidoreductase [Streblomastix strix]
MQFSTLLRNCNGGIMTTATSRYEMRVILPFLLTHEESSKGLTQKFITKPDHDKEFKSSNFHIQVLQLGCIKYNIYDENCPAKAFSMVPQHIYDDEAKKWEYSTLLPICNDVIETTFDKPNIKTLQFHQPLLEFSAAFIG